MKKVVILVGLTVFSSIGWWIGAHVGMLTAFALSAAGSVAGVYVGWRIAKDFL